MHTLRARLKRAIAFSLYYTGTLWLMAAIRLRGRAVVLMYHRVLPDGADTCSTGGIIVSPSGFALQMEFLRRHFTPLTAEQFQACIAQGAFPRRACLVTFDDGWSDNERYALPVLQRYEVPALLFIATGYVGTGDVFWQEKLTRRLWVASRSATASAPLLQELGLEGARVAGNDEARRLVSNFVTGLKAAGPAAIARIRDRVLATCSKVGSEEEAFGEDAFLTWDAVRRLASSGSFSLGSHAHSHVPLTQLGRDGALADLQRSRQEFERQGLPAPAFCAYPNGDHDAAVLVATRDAGFGVAFTTVHGHVSATDDPRRLRRINVHGSAGSSRPEFFCRLLGLF